MEKFTYTFAVEMADPDERTVSGLAAPYNETITHNGRKVQFSKGMFGNEPLANGVHLQYGHDGEPIGRVIEKGKTPDLEISESRFRGFVIDGTASAHHPGRQPPWSLCVTLLAVQINSRFR